MQVKLAGLRDGLDEDCSGTRESRVTEVFGPEQLEGMGEKKQNKIGSWVCSHQIKRCLLDI